MAPPNHPWQGEAPATRCLTRWAGARPAPVRAAPLPGEVLPRTTARDRAGPAVGLAGDRRWMLVDDTGEAVTARQHKEMLLIQPRLRADGGLEASAPPDSDLEDLVVPPP